MKVPRRDRWQPSRGFATGQGTGRAPSDLLRRVLGTLTVSNATASVVIRGHAFIQNLRRGHYELGINARNRHLRVAAAFDELTVVI